MKSSKKLYITAWILIAAALVVRYFAYPFMTNDYTDSLVPWFKTLHDNRGLSAFQYPFSDYAPLYLYIIKILSYLPVSSLYSIKTVSVLGDVFLAYVGYEIIRLIKGDTWSKGEYLLSAAVIFAIPTVLVNSSVWGQCDSLYAGLVLFSLYLIMRDRPLAAVIAFAFAVSFKLQAIFFMPVLIGYLLSRRGQILHLLAIPIVYFITLLPAAFGGGSLYRYLTIYFHQIGEYSALTLSAPSIYAFLMGAKLSKTAESILSAIGILLAMAVALWIIRLAYRQRQNNDRLTGILYAALFSVVAIPFLLPHMHERYFYMADILSVIYAIIYPRRWYVPLFVVSASLFSYTYFLSIKAPYLQVYIVNEAVWAIFMAVALVLIYRFRPHAALPLEE